MRTLLVEIQQTEEFVLGLLNKDEATTFRDKLIANPLMLINLHFQRRAYGLLKIFHRKKLKEEIKTMEIKLFENPANHTFQENIYHIFNT